MRVEKAIQLIQQDLDDPGSVNILDLNQAHRLALEGLKLIQEGRLKPGGMFFHDLPGEKKRRPNEPE